MSAKKPPITWTVMEGSGFLCKRCGGRHTLKLPMSVKLFAKVADGFTALHSECAEPGKEPSAK